MKFTLNILVSCIFALSFIFAASRNSAAQAENSIKAKKIKWENLSGKENEFYILMPGGFQTFTDGNYFTMTKILSGSVKLKGLFSSSGKITKLEVVSSPERELTEAAIKAAEQMQFLPAEKGRKLVSIYKTIEYSFSTY